MPKRKFLEAKQEALRWFRKANFDNKVILCRGSYGLGIRIGKLLLAKVIVKEVMEEGLFDGVVWISKENASDWSVRNVQAFIAESLQLKLQSEQLFSDVEDEENETQQHWNEFDAGKQIYDFLLDKKLLFVLEDPPEKGIDLTQVGIPIFYRWGLSRLLIVHRYPSIGGVQPDLVLELDYSISAELYDLIQEDCTDIASLPRFRVHFTRESVLSCFKSLCLLGKDRKESLSTRIFYYWFGEGLLGGGSDHHLDNFAGKLNIGRDLLLEFQRRDMLGTYWENLSYAIFIECKFHDRDIVFEPRFLGEDTKWILLRGGDGSQISSECPEASILVWHYAEEIQFNLFNPPCLRVLDLSGSGISTLPSSVSQNLRVLILRNCKNIREFPSTIQSSFNCLEILDIAETSLSDFRVSFENFSQIQLLDLSSNSQLLSLPSSISCCINLKNLTLKDCSSLRSGASHLCKLQALETLDLSGCCSLQDISVFNPEMPRIQNLNLSKVTGIVHLSLRGCPRLEEVGLEGCSRLELLDISGTSIKRFPHEVFVEGALKCFYMLGKFQLLKIRWEYMTQPPKELFYVDECCELLNSSATPSMEQLEPSRKDGLGGNEAFISLNNTKFFRDYNNREFFKHFQRFHVIVAPCGGRGSKGKHLRFQMKQFPYKDDYQKVSSTSMIKLSPNTHVGHFESISHKGGYLEINGGNKYLRHLSGVFNETEIFSMFSDEHLVSLSGLGSVQTKTMRECWIERCNGMKVVFDTNNSSDPLMPSLQVLWISNLPRLTTMCNVQHGEKHFGNLKHLSIEYCPKVVNVFTSNTSFGEDFRNLETLEIRFCVRLEEVFAASRSGKTQQASFPKLHTLCLWELSSLKSIVGPGVYFPSLKELHVKGCSKLNKLPICFEHNAQHDDAKIQIKGEWKWWNSIKWGRDEKGVKDRVNFIGWKPPQK